jgi:hypothetical protein
VGFLPAVTANLADGHSINSDQFFQLVWLHDRFYLFGSSEKFVGGFRFRQLAQ